MVDHPRVLNVMRDRERILELRDLYIYAGRGRCPVTRQFGEWGNPFSIEQYGQDAMRLFLEMLATGRAPRHFQRIRELFVAPYEVGCFCVGRYPACHAEVYVRLADGEPLERISTDILHRLDVDARQRDLFPSDRRAKLPPVGARVLVVAPPVRWAGPAVTGRMGVIEKHGAGPLEGFVLVQLDRAREESRGPVLECRPGDVELLQPQASLFPSAERPPLAGGDPS